MRRFALAFLASTLLCACQNGTVTLSVADAPVDGASLVKVRFASIDLVESDGSKHSFDLDPDQTVNLLAATSTQLLNTVTVPAGDYTGIILHVSADGSGTDSSITYLAGFTPHAGQTLALALPEDNVDGVTIPATFSVTRLRNTPLTADIDLRRAIVDRDQAATLTLDLAGSLTNNTTSTNVRIVDIEDVGTLTGSVAASLISADTNCAPAAIYVYEGSNVTTPGDVGGADTQPFSSTTLPIPVAGASGVVQYSVGFLPPGSYTVALICDASSDDPTQDDEGVNDIRKQTEVSIEAGVTTTVPAFQ